ncbi:hypothetical protein KQX54_010539 [Cotesia glomerata]|uniref:Uncharacterized protein n=1 Tax=Cotesia glomerata TaxID=32391 RepID=A0AAV7ICZ1_COTGL|nr:hypothetical protein KQX54_010539 [Cotesia glomerata]
MTFAQSIGEEDNDLQIQDQLKHHQKLTRHLFGASSIASGRLALAVNLAVPVNKSRLTGEHVKERVLLMSIPDDYWFE